MFKFIANKLYEKLDTPERKGMSRVKFTKALEESYRRGYSTAKQIGEEALQVREEDLMDEYSVLLATKEIELQQAYRSIKDYKAQVKDAQKAYKTYYHDSIANKRLVAEISIQIRRLFNTSGDIYKSFIAIQDSANDHFQLLIKQDPLNRNLLGMTQIPEEMNIQKKLEDSTLSQEEVKQLVDSIDDLSQTMTAKKPLEEKDED